MLFMQRGVHINRVPCNETRLYPIKKVICSVCVTCSCYRAIVWISLENIAHTFRGTEEEPTFYQFSLETDLVHRIWNINFPAKFSVETQFMNTFVTSGHMTSIVSLHLAGQLAWCIGNVASLCQPNFRGETESVYKSYDINFRVKFSGETAWMYRSMLFRKKWVSL